MENPLDQFPHSLKEIETHIHSKSRIPWFSVECLPLSLCIFIYTYIYIYILYIHIYIGHVMTCCSCCFYVARGNHHCSSENHHVYHLQMGHHPIEADFPRSTASRKLSGQISLEHCCGSTALNINISILYIHIYIYIHILVCMCIYIYICIHIYKQPFAQHTFLMIQKICIAFMEVPHTEATSSSVTCSWLGNASPKHMSSGRCLKTIQKWREIMVGSSCFRGTSYA